MEKYTLIINKTEEGLQIDESGNFSEFELIGIFDYLKNEHSKKLSKDLADYEQSRING